MNRKKEIGLYLFFGILSFIVSISSYAFFEYVCKVSPLIANCFSWVLAVSFAYITNRTWVFTDKAHGFEAVVKETFAFFTGRIATLLVEEAILYVGISIFSFHSMFVKIVGQIVVIVLNYFVSKLLVFNTRKK